MKTLGLLLLVALCSCGKPVAPTSAARLIGSLNGISLEQGSPEQRLLIADMLVPMIKRSGPLTNSEGDMLMLVPKGVNVLFEITPLGDVHYVDYGTAPWDTNKTKGQE